MIAAKASLRGSMLLRIACVAALLAIWVSTAGPSAVSAAHEAPPQQQSLPDTLQLDGTIHDFRGRDENSGHTDFEWQPTGGFAHYLGIVADDLGTDGLPVFASAGYKVNTEWQDAAGDNIMPPRTYINVQTGDVAGSKSSSTGGALHTATDFNQWFNDVAGMNMTQTVSITLKRVAGTNHYVFDAATDSFFQPLGGFFPINNQLCGNYKNTGKNFGFTYMLDTTFVYKKNAGDIFTFTGDDDVWVFIDKKLVIDIGGVHSSTQQSIALDRLNWLADGQTYHLKFFFAERHTTQSGFRLETTLNLVSTGVVRPKVTRWQSVKPN